MGFEEDFAQDVSFHGDSYGDPGGYDFGGYEEGGYYDPAGWGGYDPSVGDYQGGYATRTVQPVAPGTPAPQNPYANVDLNRVDPSRDRGLGIFNTLSNAPGLWGKIAGGIGTLTKQGTQQFNALEAGIPYSDWQGLGLSTGMDPFGAADFGDQGGNVAGDTYIGAHTGAGGMRGRTGFGGTEFGRNPNAGAGGFGGAGGVTGATGTQWGPYAGMPQQQMYETMFPTMQGIFSGNPYEVPDVNMMLPSKSRFESLDPSVMEGIMQPFKMAESQLQETLGAGGALGSARGGFSGAGAAGLGKFWGTAAPQIGQTAWGMMAPQLQQNWEAHLQRNRAPMQFATTQMPSIYPSPVVIPPTEKPSTMENALGWTTAAKNIWDIFS